MRNWFNLSNRKENLRFFLIGVLTWLLCFIKPIIGMTYTSWDTHDLGFVNFLFFSDSLRGGFFPLWNHFIQSGTFFPSFNNIGLFSPFQLIFVALSWLINPVYAFELMIQTTVMTGAVGSYLLFRCYTNDKLIALFGAVSFATVVLVPIVGQIGFVVSLSSFPWLIFACIKISRSPGNALHYLVMGALGASYLASGYPWMNMVNLSIVAFFSLGLLLRKYRLADSQKRKAISDSIFISMIFFGTMVALYGCMMIPGFLSLRYNYSLLNGDYISPEPRLRSLLAHGHFTYGSVYKALVGAIDPRIVINNGPWLTEIPKWSWGAGWVLWIFFLGIVTRKLMTMQLFWMSLLIVSIIYSSANGNFIARLAEWTPIFNANRWWVLGINYAGICLVFLSIPRLIVLKERADDRCPQFFRVSIYEFQIIFSGVLAACLLYYFRSSTSQFLLVAVVVGLLMILTRTQNSDRWKNFLSLLIIINVLATVSMPYDIRTLVNYNIASGEGGYSQQIQNRRKEVVITNNYRTVGKGEAYVFNDEQWLLQKTPYTHGYNNLGNPLVWYVKNEPFLEHLIVATQTVRQEALLERKGFASDYDFAKAMMDDVLTDMGRPTIDSGHFRDLLQSPEFQWELDDLKIEPNMVSMRVRTNAAAFLVFNNVYHPGWEAYVDGNKTELVRTNRIFQGVFLEKGGSYEVIFRFRPILPIALIFLPYIIFIFGLLALLLKFRHRCGLMQINPLFFRYLLVGGLNTVFGFSVFAFLVFLNLHYSIALLFATILGVFFNFKTLGNLVYSQNDRDLIWRFLIVYGVLYIINVSMVFIFLLFLHNVYAANALAMIFNSALGFFLNRRYVYDKN